MQKDESKTERQRALLDLLAGKELASQLDVAAAMSAQGFEVTQPSISRDFRELGIVKVDGRYRQITRNGEQVGAGLVREVMPAGAHLLVVKTEPGAAGIVGAAIDRLEAGNIIGTVAGDDTVFVAVDGKRGQRRTIELISRMG